MSEPIQRGGTWWQQRADGTWLRWDELRQNWQEAGGGPPPPDAPGAPGASRPSGGVGADYQPLKERAGVLVGFLVATVVVDAIAVVSDLAQFGLLSRATAGDFVSRGEAQANDMRQGFIALVQFGLLVLTVMLWVRWFSAAYKNTWALGAAGQRFTKGWAIGAWFVPILNLVRPKQIADDTWRASDPALPPDAGEHWKGRPVPGLFHWWWGVWILSGVVASAAFRVPTATDSLTALKNAAAATAVADALSVVAAILAILVVRRLTERQDARAARLAEGRPSLATG